MFDTEKYFPERCLLAERRLHTWAFQIMEFDVGDCLSGDLVIAAQGIGGFRQPDKLRRQDPGAFLPRLYLP